MTVLAYTSVYCQAGAARCRLGADQCLFEWLVVWFMYIDRSIKFLSMFCVVVVLQSTPQVDFTDNPMSQQSFEFYDGRLLELVKQGDPHVHQFFRLLALCHTVMPEEKNGTFRVCILNVHSTQNQP